MRLINCTSQGLGEVAETSRPEYAILSHRWEPNKHQVSYQDFNRGEVSTHDRDWAKIHATRKVALEEGLNLVWIDTCCFDKTSSAETSESINSMFRWYSNSKVCLAYLFDFDSQPPDALSNLGKSEWFYRGWTLQELIAPKRMQFYDCNWVYFGTRKELASQIATITGIDEGILSSINPGSLLPEIPIARRMSWAANRQTSRVEDKAYSLLGLFDVNIPMLYGEGERAFIRLQEEILKETTDLTIFAWKAKPLVSANSETEERYRGVLADSPSEFADLGPLIPKYNSILNPEFMTNRGLRIEILVRNIEGYTAGLAFLDLKCIDGRSVRTSRPKPSDKNIEEGTLGIYLKRRAGNIYVRCKPETLAFMEKDSQTIQKPVAYITKHIDTAELRQLQQTEVSQEPPYTSIEFRISALSSDSKNKYEVDSYPPHLWNQNRESNSFDTHDFLTFTGFIQLKRVGFFRWGNQTSHKNSFRKVEGMSPNDTEVIIACGFSGIGKPWILVTTPGEAAFEAAMAHDLIALAEMWGQQRTYSKSVTGAETWVKSSVVKAWIKEEDVGRQVRLKVYIDSYRFPILPKLQHQLRLLA